MITGLNRLGLVTACQCRKRTSGGNVVSYPDGAIAKASSARFPVANLRGLRWQWIVVVLAYCYGAMALSAQEKTATAAPPADPGVPVDHFEFRYGLQEPESQRHSGRQPV